MDKFDEYKFFAESTQHLSERRQAATPTYLTVNTAIFAVLAFLVKDTEFRGWALVLASAPLFLTGVLACWIWHRIITQYASAIGWRYEQLIAMERAMADSHQMYQKEWTDFYQPREGKAWITFSRLELWLPRMFIGLYTLYAIGLVAGAAVNP